MSKMIAILSYKHGVGRSTLLANLAVLLAARGKRVCAVDSLYHAPDLHRFFNLSEAELRTCHTYDDYRSGKCTLDQTIMDVTASLASPISGQILLVPSSILGNIGRRPENLDIDRLNNLFQTLGSVLAPDYLLADAGASLNEPNILTAAIADLLLLVMRPDQQDIHGTAILLDVTRKFGSSNIFLVVNQANIKFDYKNLTESLERIFDCPVGAILPFGEEIWALDEFGRLSLPPPDYPVPSQLPHLVDLIEESD